MSDKCEEDAQTGDEDDGVCLLRLVCGDTLVERKTLIL